MTTSNSEKLLNYRAQVRRGQALFDEGLAFEKANLEELQAMRSAYIAKIVKLRHSPGYGYDPRSPKGKPVHEEIALAEKLLRYHLEPRLQRLYGDWLVGQVREAFATPEQYTEFAGKALR